MTYYKKILIICPGGTIAAAGPEALHQLAAKLNQLQQPAVMVYHPFNKAFSVPVQYEKYQVPVELFQDEADTLIVYPEIFTALALKPRHAKTAIWWMSVNNFTCIRYANPLRDKIRYWKNILKGRIPWQGINALKKLSHFAQSHYATEFLDQHGINSFSLSDPIPVYTDSEYLDALTSRLEKTYRENIICYNPSKGAKITEKLIAAYPQWSFKPLRGLNREQLADAFLSAKIYIDFGHHPGKDRLPREAAIHGCCIITGVYGSAANPIDIPIPEQCKLDDRKENFLTSFGMIVTEIFDNFDLCSQELKMYRNIISQEPANFESQIIKAFRLGSQRP
jgi:hypothetical protein